MELTPYVKNLGREFAMHVETGGDDPRALVERASTSLESAIRLTLLDALSDATDEITRDLAPGSVELRLRGREPSFVVTPTQPDQPTDWNTTHDNDGAIVAPSEATSSNLEEGAMTRVNLRLPEQLKSAVEEAATQQGRSINAWLVRVISTALQQQDRGQHQSDHGGKRGAQHYTGWVR